MPEHNPLPTPERALYGFSLYIASYLFSGFFLLWAYIPDSILQKAGFVHLPHKFWAVALPAFTCIFLILSYFGYFMINVFHSFQLLGEIEEYEYILHNHSTANQSTTPSVPSLQEIEVLKNSARSSKTVCLVQLASLE